MPHAVLAVVAFAKHASDASVGWPELDKNATPPPQFLSRNYQFTSHNHSYNLPTAMVFPALYPSLPETHAPSPLPDGPKEDDLMAQWAQHAGYAQPEPVEGIDIDFEGLEALLAWELGDTLPEPTPASQLGGGLDFDWTTTVARNVPGNSAALDYLAAAPIAATALMPAPLAANIFDLPVSMQRMVVSSPYNSTGVGFYTLAHSSADRYQFSHITAE
ncbi:hypothetical protein H4582DRAFT_240432 [Lactarius indigo]|nr:hypothetical protein H4582DRAFT_240432 [Lactarius indigo]